MMHVYEKEIIAEGRMTKEINSMIRQVSREIVKEYKEAEPDEEEKVAMLKRGLSIADYYSPFAGLAGDEIKSDKLDTHSNPEGTEYDLGVDKTFNTFGVIMYSYNDKEEGQDPTTLFQQSERSLKEKGFNVYVSKNEDDFLEKLPSFDEAWIASADRNNCKNSKTFIEALEKFHKAGKGIALWADNQNVQASLFLKHINGITLEGTTPGNGILKIADDITEPGTCSKHLVTTGIAKLFEGWSISYPKNHDGKINVIGHSSNGNPCIFSIESENAGRIIVDCGFSKLYPNYWMTTAGTGRYVRNIAVWLLGLDWRTGIKAPLQGDITDLLASSMS